MLDPLVLPTAAKAPPLFKFIIGCSSLKRLDAVAAEFAVMKLALNRAPSVPQQPIACFFDGFLTVAKDVVIRALVRPVAGNLVLVSVVAKDGHHLPSSGLTGSVDGGAGLKSSENKP